MNETLCARFHDVMMNLLKRLISGSGDSAASTKAELEQGKLLKKVGRKGRGRAQFDMPCGVTTTHSGDLVVVSDTDNHRIQIFSMDGVFRFKFGERGSSPHQLCYPAGVAVTSKDSIVVSDSVNVAVKLFSLEGQLEKHITCPAQLELPYGVAVTSDDHVVVTDIYKHSVVVFQPSGEFSHSFGCYGDGPREFDHPYCVTTNSSNQIIVSDTGNSAVKIFHFQGRLLRYFSTTDFRLTADIFVSLYGVCTDADDNTLVVCTSGVYILTKDGRLWEVLTSKDGLTSPRCVTASSASGGRLLVTQAGYDTRHELCLFRYNREDFRSLNTLVYYAISI
ncbi:hypothetical protein EGW08_002164 [Elysia chlorotica]|uniref:Uncharacterized protein n=1 Tax=Elysia chlorotica TaxID=188477 RepID=A0A3S1A402_ELYCH|nr:hypothetical protein EGW08_002164 [Elysia chlorotica]